MHMNPRIVPILLAIIAAGCGGGTSATAGPTAAMTAEPTEAPTAPTVTPEPEMTFVALDACAILPKNAAEKIAGTPLDPGLAGNPLNPSCMYTGPVTGPLGQVSIFIGDGAKKTYDIDVQLNHEFKPVAGLGDEAYLENNGIFFRKGTTWVAIELVRLNDPAENAKPLIDAAKAVAAQLP